MAAHPVLTASLPVTVSQALTASSTSAAHLALTVSLIVAAQPVLTASWPVIASQALTASSTAAAHPALVAS